jgi:radical SAM superfamily enzyme YgiQ (UPF0313 family)
MKIEIVNIPSKINRDCMGSFGLGSEMGEAIIPRAIGWAKSRSVRIPDLQAACLATKLTREGHLVSIVSKPGPADAHYFNTSMSGYLQEIEAACTLPKVTFFGAMANAKPEFFTPYGKIERVIPDIAPLWGLYDYKKFRYFPSLRCHPVAPMITATGCQYACAYCPYHSYFEKWIPRPVESVVSEIKVNARYYGVKGIVFRDPLFTAERDRAIKIMTELSKENIQWVCETRIEKVDINLLETMEQSGCQTIHFGVESSNPDVMKSVNRNSPPKEQQKEIIDACERIGIRTTCFFILGFQADTVETVNQTIDYSVWLNPNVAEFFVATPYPGTRLHDEVVVTKPYHKMTGFNLCYEHKVFTEKSISDLRNKAYKKFYMRTGFFFKNML